MVYVCKKQMYDSIANVVTRKDLDDAKQTLPQFMCDYFAHMLSWSKGTITEVIFK